MDGIELVKAYQEGKRDFSHALLISINLDLANFYTFRGICLNDADLSKSNLQTIDLSGSECNRAKFVQANLQNAHFKRAKCQQACFRGTDLRGVDFRNAFLSGADFSGADLRGAKLAKSIIDSPDHGIAIFDGAIYNESTEFPGEFNLEESNLINSSGMGDQEIQSYQMRILGNPIEVLHLLLNGSFEEISPQSFNDFISEQASKSQSVSSLMSSQPISEFSALDKPNSVFTTPPSNIAKPRVEPKLLILLLLGSFTASIIGGALAFNLAFRLNSAQNNTDKKLPAPTVTQRVTARDFTPPPTPNVVQPPSNATVTGTAESKNIRSGPGTDYPVIGSVFPGDRVQILARNFDYGGYSWDMVYDPKSRVRGWIAAHLIDPD